MQKTWREKLMLACAALLVLACGTVFVRVITDQLLVKKLHMDNVVVQYIFSDSEQIRANQRSRDVHIAWVKKYPFAVADNEEDRTHRDAPFQRADKKIKSLEKRIDSWTNKYFLQYITWVRLANAYQDKINWNVSVIGGYNSVVTLPDGHMVEFQKRQDVTPLVQVVRDLSNTCHEQGVNFVFVLAPSKISPTDTAYAGYMDFTNENSDAFLAGLHETGVDCLDLRTVLPTEGEAKRAMFFKTDHHWLPSTARMATGYICQYLHDQFGYEVNLELLEPNQYSERVFPLSWLGSRGRKKTLPREQADSFTLYYPKFMTSLHVSIPNLRLSTEGDFSCLYDMSVFEIQDVYVRNLYGVYAYGDRDLEQIENMQRHDGKKLLLVHDSFGDAVIPFLSLETQYLDAIDLRSFSGSLKGYIEQNQPDTVVVLYFVEQFNNKADYSSHKYLFDFR